MAKKTTSEFERDFAANTHCFHKNVLITKKNFQGIIIELETVFNNKKLKAFVNIRDYKANKRDRNKTRKMKLF